MEYSKKRLRALIDQLVATCLDIDPQLLEGMPRIQQDLGASHSQLQLLDMEQVSQCREISDLRRVQFCFLSGLRVYVRSIWNVAGSNCTMKTEMAPKKRRPRKTVNLAKTRAVLFPKIIDFLNIKDIAIFVDSFSHITFQQ